MRYQLEEQKVVIIDFFLYLWLFCQYQNSTLMCVKDGMVICHLPYGPTAYFTLYNSVMRHDIPNVGTMSEQYPHLIFHNFTTERGERVRHSR